MVPYKCDECDYKSVWRSALNVHFKAKHLGFKQSCDECDFSSTNLASVREHIQYEHKNVRLFCDKCTFQTKRKTALNTHMQRTHEDTKQQNVVEEETANITKVEDNNLSAWSTIDFLLQC